MGKSFLALELACRLRQPLRRIYYATFKDGASAERLWRSAMRRQSLPSLFVLDDCHLSPEAAESLLQRLGPELRSGKLELVLLLRDQVGAATDQLDDSLPWLARLEEERAVIDLRADVARTLAIASHLRPDFTGLSRSRLERLHKTCGGDLLLLDEILQTLAAPQDIDTFEVGKVLANVRTHYFGGNAGLPTLTKLAALAQFDLVPRADFFLGQWRPDEEKSADPLMTRLFAPPRYQFLHSSLAAVVLRALAQLDVGKDALDDAVASITASVVRDYLLHLSALSERSEEFVRTVQMFLRGKQPLGGKLTEAHLRSAVLGEKAIESAIESDLAKQSFTNLGQCVRWLSAADHPAKARYVELIEQRFRILFEQANDGGDTVGMNTAGTGLLVLRRHAPDRWGVVLDEHGADSFLGLVLANGSLSDLFRVLQNSTPEFRAALLEKFTPEQAGALLDKTIAAGRSIGTLHLPIRELGKDDRKLLIRLELVVGAAGFMRLILANGTLFELFRHMQYATPDFRTALLENLTSEQAAALLDKTIDAKRSIATLHWTLRELGEADENLLARLERVIGAAGFMRLILANGTLFELFKHLALGTPEFRTALLEQVTSAQAEALVDKTIAAGRSIGTLPLAMRELGKDAPELLVRLERVIGAPGFMRLILAKGSLFELFKLLEQATPEFRTALLEQVTSAQAEALVDKTIAAGRSIGTLPLAMRELGKDAPELLVRLERVIGAPGFMRLILANGSLFELFRILEHASPELRNGLLEQITPAQAETLLCKAITVPRSIENLHFTVRSLATSSDQPTRLEGLLGVEGWWRLLIACGSLNSVSQITLAMNSGLRARIIAGATNLSVADWHGIIARGLFLNACAFATSDLQSYPEVARNTFRTALIETATPLAAQASWFDLNPSRPPAEPENAEGVILREAFRARMQASQLSELFKLDFREAANGLACCWRERPDLRLELGKNVRKILPPCGDWPRDDGEFGALRVVLEIARDTEFPEVDARLLLADGISFLDQEVCEGIHTLPLFGLVWSMAELFYERAIERSFSGAFPQTTRKTLLAVLADRISPKGPNQEKVAQFALAGLLAFLYPQYKLRLIKLLAPLKGAVRWLGDMALQESFVPAVFTLEGISLQALRESVFTPWVCSMLLLQYSAEKNDSAALKTLRLHISGKHERKANG